MKKAKEKIEIKINMYRVDHVLIKELDSLNTSEPEQEEKKKN